ncbi:MAG: hypothetical protein WA843_02690 [Candidatus Saccharimonadales bacterium]
MEVHDMLAVVAGVFALIALVGGSAWTSKNAMLRSEPANQRLRNSRNGFMVFTLIVLLLLIALVLFL